MKVDQENRLRDPNLFWGKEDDDWGTKNKKDKPD
jgi:hypothetical protein